MRTRGIGTILTGYHAVRAALQTRGTSGELLLCVGGTRAAELQDLAEQRAITVHSVTRGELEHRCGAQARQAGLILSGGSSESWSGTSTRAVEHLSAGEVGARSLGLLLDGVTDVGNIGAILRSAEQFEADFVAAGRLSTAQEDYAVRHATALARASAGATLHFPLWSCGNVARAIEHLQHIGFWVYGADNSGEPIQTVDVGGAAVLLMGAEGRGLAQLTREHCDRLVSIPTGGRLDSLNVSVAAAILMYEVRRRQDYFAVSE